MLKFIFSHIKKYKVKFISYISISLILLLFNLLSPYIERIILDSLIYKPDYYFLTKTTILILLLSIISSFLSYFQNMIMIKLNTEISFNISNIVINHLKKVNIQYISKYNSAYLCEQINTDCNDIISFFFSNFISIFSNIFIIIFCFFWIFSHYDLTFIVLVSIIIPIYIIIYISLKKPLYNKTVSLLENQSNFFTVINNIFKNLKSIKTKVLFSESESDYKNSFSNLLKSVLSLNKITYVFSSLNNICSTISRISIILFGGIKIIEGNITIGDFTLINSYCNMIVSSTTYYLTLGENYQKSKASYLRLKKLLDIPNETNGTLTIKELKSISLKNLTFSYAHKRILINNFSFELKKGFSYAIVGNNGSGKSTLIDLILGILNKNYSGDILYNNINIKKLDMYDIRKNLISVVEQEPYLNTDTILNNITLNCDDIDNYRISDLLVKFNLKKVIDSLPNGIETIITDTIKNLSGGERQKIAVINSIFKNPDLIILDEPTSALDKDSIKVLENILNELKSNKIIILISHDKDFYNICDYIINI